MTPLPLDVPLARCGCVIRVADWDGVTFHYVCQLRAGHDGVCRGYWIEQTA